MIELQRKRVERAVSDMINETYMTSLRKMQSDMHVCAARCCDDQYGSLDSIQGCIESCAMPLTRAQDYLQRELNNFQGQLQNCVMQCNDDIRNRAAPYPTETDIAKYQKQFEGCTVKCVDKHIGLLPNMMKTIKTVLAKGPKPKVTDVQSV